MKKVLIFIGAIICASLSFANAASEAEQQAEQPKNVESAVKNEDDPAIKSQEAQGEQSARMGDDFMQGLVAKSLIDGLAEPKDEKKVEELKAEGGAAAKVSEPTSEKAADAKVSNENLVDDKIDGKDILDGDLDDEDFNIEPDDLESLIDSKKDFDI